MALVSRTFTTPPVMRSVQSTETSTHPCCLHSPFTHTEIASMYDGNYSGVTTPGWRQKRNEGNLLPMSYYYRFDRTASQSGHRDIRWKAVSCVPNCIASSRIASCGIFEDSGTLVSDVDLRNVVEKYLSPRSEGLLQEATANIGDQFDALTFAAEFNQVKTMFSSLGFRVLSHLAKRPLKSAADLWLQWQFGWKPLFSDMQAIARIIEKPWQPMRLPGKAKSEYSNSNEFVITKKLPNNEIHNYTVRDNIHGSVQSIVWADLSAAQAKLTTNVAVTAWEIIPYSFVIDYFFNIGSWIKAASFLTAQVSYVASVGYYVSWERTISLTPGGFDPAIMSGYSCDGHATVSSTLRIRTPRSISLGVPRINTDILSATRIINLITLALQKIR